MFKERKDFGCQVSVYRDKPEDEDCGEPVVAVWEWEKGFPLYVCEKHDLDIQEREEEAWYTPPLRRKSL